MGFGDRPAVIVVDFSNGFTDPALPLGAPVDDAIAHANRLIDAAHATAVPVFFSTIRYDALDFSDAGVWLLKMAGLATLRANTTAVEIDARLHREPRDAILVKRYASCFFGTELASRLRSQGIDTLVIAGCATSGCVRATAVDACQNGLRTIVVREAVSDRSGAAHRQSLVDIEAMFGDVVAVADVVAHFTRMARPATTDRRSI